MPLPDLEPIIESPELARIGKPQGPEAPPAGEAIRLEFIPVSALTVDRRYQRRTSDGSRSRIRKIVSDFSWSKFGAIAVTEVHEGLYAIIDGQHRALAATLIGADAVPAVIARGDLAAQAKDFVGINSVRTSVAAIDKFRARVASGDVVAIAVDEMLKELEISTDVPAGAGIRHKETRAVSTLEKLQKRLGRGVVFTTLETMLDAQPGQNNLLTAFAIDATATVVGKMLDAGRELSRLDSVLAETDFETLKEEAQQLQKLTGGQTSAKGAQLLLQKVNKGLREKIA
ncbi:ParB N-terminal domain-containing protein [Salipiger bermudensis]|uniref:ParB N-terminal domain-containing protein n=1 Tax=Salipiger bermudensis TaxID=344736 RepID=UPI001CD2D9EE|nr:ParB N-terminal domain-containing protein [Salipiger bermudensis]MCA0963312.1 ParB/RepB/Spo0J family partition protein [Salipiger bermudensis]